MSCTVDAAAQRATEPAGSRAQRTDAAQGSVTWEADLRSRRTAGLAEALRGAAPEERQCAQALAHVSRRKARLRRGEVQYAASHEAYCSTARADSGVANWL